MMGGGECAVIRSERQARDVGQVARRDGENECDDPSDTRRQAWAAHRDSSRRLPRSNHRSLLLSRIFPESSSTREACHTHSMSDCVLMSANSSGKVWKAEAERPPGTAVTMTTPKGERPSRLPLLQWKTSPFRAPSAASSSWMCRNCSGG